MLLPFCVLILWRVFLQVVLPITLNGVATGATIIFFIAWGSSCMPSRSSRTRASTRSAC